MRQFSFTLLFLLTVLVAFGQAPKAKNSDFEVLTGAPFTGTLTYHNHLTGTVETVPVTLKVTPSKKEKDAWNFSYEFPDEPNENDTETIVLLSGGRYLNEEEVVDRFPEKEDLLRIVTEDTKAHTQKVRFFKYSYLIGKNRFRMEEVEKLRGEDSFRPVRTYEFKR